MGSTSEYDGFAIIYAGASVSTPSDSGGGLRPNAGGNHYMTEELDDASGPAGWIAGILVNTHEFGHLLGLNDMYGGDTNYGLGYFSLMGVHPPPWGLRECPPHVSSFGKLRLGWVNPHELVSSWTGIGLPNVEENDTAFVFDLSGMTANDWQQGEYFIIENRQPRGFDIRMQDYQTHVGGGLLIYHHGTSFFANGEEIKIFEADGTNDLEEYLGNAGDLGDFYPGTSVNRTFDVNSTPNSRMQDGSESNFTVINISDSDSLMTMDIDVNGPPSAPILGLKKWTDDHPLLYWYDGGEPDLDHFVLKRQVFSSTNYFTVYGNSYVDTDYVMRSSGFQVKYWVQAVDASGLSSPYSNEASTIVAVLIGKAIAGRLEEPLPEKYDLTGNQPNPFNPSSSILYELPQASRVQLTIYDVMGREVFTHAAVEEAGYKQLQWQGKDHSGQAVPSGVYLYRLVAIPAEGGKPYIASRKLLLLK